MSPTDLIDPFAAGAEGVWLKGNLHAHTTESDGAVSPERRAAEYREQGYDFLCLSDHHRVTRVNRVPVPDGLTLIQGAELHPDNPFGGLQYHLLAYNMTDDLDAERMPPQHVIDAVREQGGSVWLAHPHWISINVRRDVLPLTGLAGIEVFNTICHRMGRGESGQIWDDWLDHASTLLPAIANDDCHGPSAQREDRFQGWTMVRAAECTPQAIVAALERGASYCTTGPEIRSLHVERSAGSEAAKRPFRLEVSCSEALRVAAICSSGGADYPAGPLDPAHPFEQATLPLPAADWVRVEVIDAHGRKAWSNPIDLTRLGAAP